MYREEVPGAQAGIAAFTEVCVNWPLFINYNEICNLTVAEA